MEGGTARGRGRASGRVQAARPSPRKTVRQGDRHSFCIREGEYKTLPVASFPRILRVAFCSRVEDMLADLHSDEVGRPRSDVCQGESGPREPSSPSGFLRGFRRAVLPLPKALSAFRSVRRRPLRRHRSPWTGQVYDRWAPIGLKQKGTDRQGGLGRAGALDHLTVVNDHANENLVNITSYTSN